MKFGKTERLKISTKADMLIAPIPASFELRKGDEIILTLPWNELKRVYCIMHSFIKKEVKNINTQYDRLNKQSRKRL